MMESGNDTISGSIGRDGGGNAVGKGIQQVRVDLGDHSQRDVVDILDQLNKAVFGDGYNWEGVVRELRQIRRDMEQITAQMKTLQQEVSVLKEKLGERGETSNQMRLLLWLVVFGIFALIGIALWPLIF